MESLQWRHMVVNVPDKLITAYIAYQVTLLLTWIYIININPSVGKLWYAL